MRTLLALVIAPVFCWASDADEVREALDRSSWHRVSRLLTGEAGKRLSRDPEQIRGLARRATDLAFRIAQAGTKGELAVRAFESVAKELTDAPRHHTLAARGEIHLLRARFLRSHYDSKARLIRKPDGQANEEFRSAATLFVAAHADDNDDSEALARAVVSLVEGSWGASETRAESLKLAEQQAATLEKRHGTSAARSAILFEPAKHELASARKSTEIAKVKETLQAALDRLAPFVTGRSADIEIPTLYNELVAFGRAHGKKLRMDLEFRADDWRPGRLRMKLPRSRLISARGAYGDQIFGEIHQWRADGRGFRHFVLCKYKWNTEYTSGPRGIGGDNPKGLLQGGYDDAVASLKRRSRNSRIVKGRLNRSIPSGYRYEVLGTDSHGQTAGFRGYCFKGKRRKITIELWIEELCCDCKSKMDPVGEFILESMYEAP